MIMNLQVFHVIKPLNLKWRARDRALPAILMLNSRSPITLHKRIKTQHLLG